MKTDLFAYCALSAMIFITALKLVSLLADDEILESYRGHYDATSYIESIKNRQHEPKKHD